MRRSALIAVGVTVIAVTGCSSSAHKNTSETTTAVAAASSSASSTPSSTDSGATDSSTTDSSTTDSSTTDSGTAGASATGPDTATPGSTSADGAVSLTATPDGMLHPCSLLTLAEAEALAGTTLAAGVEAPKTGIRTLCQYVGPSTGPLAQVQIIVGDGAKKVLDIDRGILKHRFSTLSGVADEAYAEDDNAFLRKGDTWVSVNLARLNDAAQNAKAIRTAAGEVAQQLG